MPSQEKLEPPDDAISVGESKNLGSLNGPKRKRRVGWQVVLGSFGTIFLTAAFSLHSWPSIPFAIAGISCGSWVLKIELENRSFARPIPRNWAIILALVSAGVWGVVFLTQQEDAPKKPRFAVSYILPDDPPLSVQLTNEFLFNNSYEGTFLATGMLCIPPRTNQSYRELLFSVRNLSPDTPADDVMALVSFSEPWKLVSTDGWNSMEKEGRTIGSNRSGVLTTNSMQNLTFFLPVTLLPGCGMALPPLRIEGGSMPDYCVLTIVVRARGTPSTVLSFAVGFWPTTTDEWITATTNLPNITKPILVQGELTNGRVFFSTGLVSRVRAP